MMNGMLWHNSEKKALAEKIKEALAYYLKKYQVKAEVCLVNPAEVEGLDLEQVSKESGIVVRTFRGVLKSHLWLGVEEKLVKA